jgi:hypothetical protein
MYLHDHDISRGSAVQELLDNHLRPRTDVVNDLADIERDLNRQLRLMGFNPESFYRRFSIKRREIDRPLNKRVLLLGANIGRKLYNRFNILFLKLPYSEYILSSENRYFRQELENRNMHNKSKWPLKAKEYYQKNTNSEHFEEDVYDDFWFTK